MTDYRFPIYRANEYNLRKQIMEALEYLGKFPVLKVSIDEGEIAFVPSGSQMIVYEAMTINGGWLNLEGELVVLGGAYRDEAHTHDHESPYTMVSNQGNYAITGADATLTGP